MIIRILAAALSNLDWVKKKKKRWLLWSYRQNWYSLTESIKFSIDGSKTKFLFLVSPTLLNSVNLM